jgi:hypothetical protein
MISATVDDDGICIASAMLPFHSFVVVDDNVTSSSDVK